MGVSYGGGGQSETESERERVKEKEREGGRERQKRVRDGHTDGAIVLSMTSVSSHPRMA